MTKGESRATGNDSSLRDTVLEQLRLDRTTEDATRKSNDKEIYKLNYKQIDDTFVLPGKPEPSGI